MRTSAFSWTGLFIPGLLLLSSGCSVTVSDGPVPDYRQEMRLLISEIASSARTERPGFLVVPQNGQELLTLTDDPDSTVIRSYRDIIDGTGREDLFFGYTGDGRETPLEERDYLLAWCRLYESLGIEVLVTDYCSDPADREESRRLNKENGFISFAAPERDLTDLPPAEDSDPSRNVAVLPDARNFLYLLNYDNFSTREELLSRLESSEYDLIILDLFYGEDPFTAADLIRLKRKPGGGNRLLLCYMSIGEAEDYRFYWDESWSRDPPSWLGKENPSWKGNYKVRYWEEAWKEILRGSEESYIQRILAAGFDGVYLDLVDAYEYYENS